MTFREDINSQGDLVARPWETTRLTRRAVSAGAAAAAGGAVVLALGRFFDSAAAAPTTTSGNQPCAAQAAASPVAGKTQVVVENFTFTPDVLTVPLGTEVTWENKDDIPHTVTSDDKKTFASSLLDTGDRFTYTFTKPGTFSYFCSVHPMMTAKVVVQS